jgi:Arc/MetJ-type ribon-helix-helix transcriptional regulator
MTMLNVRLSEADARIVKALKRRGVSASEVVRDALRAKAAAGVVPDDTDAVLAEMARCFPRGRQRSKVDATDRRAVQAFLRRRLTRKRP